MVRGWGNREEIVGRNWGCGGRVVGVAVDTLLHKYLLPLLTYTWVGECGGFRVLYFYAIGFRAFPSLVDAEASMCIIF